MTQAVLEATLPPIAPAYVTPAFDAEVERAVRIYSRRLLGVAGFTEQHLDDIRQEMRLELMTRLPSFDPSRAMRSTFVARVLERKAGQLVRRRVAAKRDYRREEHSLNDAIRDADGRKTMRVQVVADADRQRHMKHRMASHVEAHERLHHALAGLPEPQRAICIRLMQVSRKQLCRETGMPARTLQRHLREIRLHITRACMEE